ncbi:MULTISPECIES: hypothetical protein [unclassified Moraxella]|uniref:hypothetical protein n=1 Tax=unclassified Moraxella TaxID=2685852 RepID=UPI002B40B2FC|nr:MULTISPECIES: hypothetical protein [unclassified Moraxella]
MNKRLANVLSLTLFFVGVVAVAISITQNNGYAYHAFALCALLSVLADLISIKSGNKMATATVGQKRFVLMFQIIVWAIGLWLIYHFKLFHPS